MPHDTKELLRSGDKLPLSQYFNDKSDNYEVVKGSNGAIATSPQGSTSLVGALQIVAVAGTKVQLPSNECREVTIIAKRGNTGYIYVGGSNVSSTAYGVELSEKESYTFMVSNTNLIWITSSVSGEGISYVSL